METLHQELQSRGVAIKAYLKNPTIETRQSVVDANNKLNAIKL